MDEDSTRDEKLDVEKRFLSSIFEEEAPSKKEDKNSFPFETPQNELIEMLVPLTSLFANLDEYRKVEFVLKLKELVEDFKENKDILFPIEERGGFQKLSITFTSLQDVLSYLNDIIEGKE